ncbi:MAG: 1-deoxy-D-xylulose-5-phosphate reductoisomerase [Betaproteobacteria bacterium CG2_30_59_46]|nr:MAG: 1-deoxy-D-xylulose-5-phosphate reductoisomerase [Betaproteobacteria bacterium CG2_30_59_46]PIQ14123.1 MAG: 1-deoxy-D-xylulose-5-phosphate reductoisomerase [Hydrogenophilales bacterium CG18_big_fil_WC_8_21_14_2_50_58_12]PIY00310.1 MAG: 1-deoxy-D-xylulose-5-phosphate reductoisomerase [Hydrogenophilales bacterium CG_4_10_14_3_um_filter_58_23]
MPKIQNVTVLGSTGTIGMNTLDVVARHAERFRVVALTANRQVERLFEQCRKFQPDFAVMLDPDCAQELQAKIRLAGLDVEVLSGIEALERVASHPQVDSVMAAIVGSAGLRPSLAAAKAGKRILLANKETLVMSGSVFMDAVKQYKATLLPIDSEHNAIFQSLPRNFSGDLDGSGVKRILLTASGGPFRTVPLCDLDNVTPDQACAHPNWVMGRKISVDSATMMNKGLEVIEAHWLFNADADKIQVVIHPQSVIHSMVEYIDGSVLAQLGNPDMRTPIAYALGFPERIDAGVSSLDLFKIARLDFEAPDTVRFPCLDLAYEALRQGGTTPAIMNAANEVAVEAFLDERLPFKLIPAMIESVLKKNSSKPVVALEDVIDADAGARVSAREWMRSRGYA